MTTRLLKSGVKNNSCCLLIQTPGIPWIPKQSNPKQNRFLECSACLLAKNHRMLCFGILRKTFSNALLWNSRTFCFGMLERSASERSNGLLWKNASDALTIEENVRNNCIDNKMRSWTPHLVKRISPFQRAEILNFVRFFRTEQPQPTSKTLSKPTSQ